MNEETRYATTALRITKLCSEIIEEIHAYEAETERLSENMQYTLSADLRHTFENAERTLENLSVDWFEMVCIGRVAWAKAMRESEMDESLLYCPWPVRDAYKQQISISGGYL